MNKGESNRRNFIKFSTLALGGLSIAPAIASANESYGLPPVSAQEEKKLHILCIGAHPGDPEFGCGGTMARYSDAGHSVTFLYLTRGEAWAGDKSLSFDQAAALRTKEAETSCKILNVKALFAGQIDDNTELNKKRAEELTKLILSVNPDLVFTHWPLDSHMDHQVTACLTYTAWIKSEQKFDLYYYEIDTGSETVGFNPTDYVDITEVRDRKKAAMMAHKTQGPEKIYDTDFKTMEDFRGMEAGVKAAEAIVHFKVKAQRACIMGLE
jgi:LmbE family N-acetylglucosaminyl deacetylase